MCKIFLAVILLAFGAPFDGGAAMLIAARASFAISRAKRWTNPYVTDGLVAMWDGEWNVAGGVHDPNATTWVDLSGNGHDFTWAASTAGVAWGANYIQLTNGAKSNIVVAQFTPALHAQTASGVIAADWVYADNYSNSQTPILTTGNVLNSRLRSTTSGRRVAYLVASIVNGNNFAYGRDNNDMPIADDYNIVQSCCVGTNTAYTAYVYNNGIEYPVYKNSTTTANITSTILRRPPRTNFRIYNYLIYNRDLTAAEIAANYAVDRGRFNLP